MPHLFDIARRSAAAMLVLAAGIPANAQTERDPDAGTGPAPEVLLRAESSGAPDLDRYRDRRRDERQRMVTVQIEGRGVSDPAVLDAMRAVPRHEFVPEARRGTAYADRPLPIGHGQTISQPFIVAYMTGQLQVSQGDRVLEIGTGSGYQAAVLAAMGVEVVSIEIIRPLAESAAARLEKLGFGNVTVLHGDGYYGFRKNAPYDGIIVTAAAAHVPPPLVAQLKPGKRMLIPVGRAGWTQNLLRIEKTEEGQVRTRNLMSVAFVPLTGEH